MTALLHAWSGGDVAAREELIPLVYAELRRQAAAQLRRESRRDSLQPTALVHEAYLRLIDQNRVAWQSRAHFLAIASQTMRRILVDRARARRAVKRSGRWERVTLDGIRGASRAPAVEIIDLDAALRRLAALDPRKSRVAELRFFGGLSLKESAEVLGIGMATVERDWQVARAWLFDALTSRRGDDA